MVNVGEGKVEQQPVVIEGASVTDPTPAGPSWSCACQARVSQ
jgi:hypothetical protein